MSSRGFLQKPFANAVLLKHRKGSLAPLIPVFGDPNTAEVDIFSEAFWPGITPKPLKIVINGESPEFYQAINLTPVQATINIFGNTPSVISTQQIEFTGRGYKVEPDFVLVPDRTIEFTGQGYEVIPEFLGGFLFDGSGYQASLSATLQPDYNINFTGNGYRATLDAHVSVDYDIQFTGRGYRVTPEFLGGFIFNGQGFKASLTAHVETSELISFTGHGYAVNPVMSMTPIVAIQFTGHGYQVGSLRGIEFNGRGYAVYPNFDVTINTAYAEAFVMNLLTQEVTRYTNYPFSHLAKIGNDYYGIKADGLYKITGNLDLTDPVTDITSMTTKATDFGEFQIKNVSHLYANADSAFNVTAIVDDVLSVQQAAIFAGRKVKLGQGAKGRYWAFKLDNFSKLQGLEFLPKSRQRRI